MAAEEPGPRQHPPATVAADPGLGLSRQGRQQAVLRHSGRRPRSLPGGRGSGHRPHRVDEGTLI